MIMVRLLLWLFVIVEYGQIAVSLAGGVFLEHILPKGIKLRRQTFNVHPRTDPFSGTLDRKSWFLCGENRL
jgi:hypothetical protein